VDGSLRLGDIVCSTAGRDKDTVYLVVSEPENHLFGVVDGKNRKFRRLKMKNGRHLEKVGRIKKRVLMTRMEAGRMDDNEVRHVLRSYTQEEGCSSDSPKKLIADILPAQEEAG